jgi:hypothetical protein
MQNLVEIEQEEFMDKLRSIAEEETVREFQHTSYVYDATIEAAHRAGEKISREHPMETYAYLVQNEPLEKAVNLNTHDSERGAELGTTPYKLQDNYTDFDTSTELINEIISSVATRVVAEFIDKELIEADWNGVQKEQVEVIDKVEVGDETKEVTGTETQYKVNHEFIEKNCE